MTVREALEQSLNSASVRIGLACGLDPIIRTMHTLGVNAEIDNQPAMLLGAVGVPPIEMADAYSTIARVGSRGSVNNPFINASKACGGTFVASWTN